MNICGWVLRHQQKSGYPKIDKDNIAKVQIPDFHDGLKGDENAVDVLSQTLGATFLHEVRLYAVSYCIPLTESPKRLTGREMNTDFYPS